MSEKQSESKEGAAKEVKRCGKHIVHEGNAVCVFPVPDGQEQHVCVGTCWWCTDHELMRVQKEQPCPQCYSEKIEKLSSMCRDWLGDTDQEIIQLRSDISTLHGAVQLLGAASEKRTGRIAEEEILIRSLEPYVTLREIVRIICCAPVVLAGYQAAIQGGAALDLGLLKVDLRDHILGDICKAMDRLEQERIAQIRAEHRKAAEYLKLAPMFLSGLSSIKRAFTGK